VCEHLCPAFRLSLNKIIGPIPSKEPRLPKNLFQNCPHSHRWPILFTHQKGICTQIRKQPTFSRFVLQNPGETRLMSRLSKVILEPSSYTAQKFALYQKYQAEIHQDKRNSPSGFKTFLVDSPLVVSTILLTLQGTLNVQ